uniref:Uncharacterized protein n=1 Tax=Anser cygnoides TaxID=8845 RepID=A0A8B9DTF4_ANSCY
MSLKPFTYLLPETRFLHAGRLVYKFKIRYGSFKRLEKISKIIWSNCPPTTNITHCRIIESNLEAVEPWSSILNVYLFIRLSVVSKLPFAGLAIMHS